MSVQLYKIIFDKNSLELNDDYDRLSEYEKEVISSMSVDAFFDYDNLYDLYTCFLITDEHTIRSYISILKNNFVKHEIINISKDAILNHFNFEKELENLLDPTSRIKFNIFIDSVNDWIFEHLDIDIVLDRINEVGGIQNLRQIEKKFLKNYK